LNFRFENIIFLSGLAVVPLVVFLFWRLLKWKKETSAAIGDPSLVKELLKNYSPKKFNLKFLLSVIALAVVIIAIANLQRKGKMENVTRKGVDVMIVMDVSKSMLAQDIKPSRLERAKQLVNKIIERMENDRIGLVLFAGRAYMQMPLTTDHAASKMYVQNAGPDVVPTQGTVIAEALKMANSAFNSKERKYKSIVLISDGEDHDPEALPVAKTLQQDGVMINTVGIGSPEGAPIIDPNTNDYKKDAQGNNVITKLNEAELQQLAQAGNGIYERLEDPTETADAVTKQLGTIEQKAVSDNSFVNYISYFYWFIALAIVLLLVEMFVSEKKMNTSL
jgi:Ca-activated chloride channel family protein